MPAESFCAGYPLAKCACSRSADGFLRSRQLFSWISGVLCQFCMQLIGPTEQIHIFGPSHHAMSAPRVAQSLDSALLHSAAP
jgi:hypothetical protein